MAKVHDIDGLSTGDIEAIISDGGKFVVFPYCVSLIVVSFRRSSDVYLLRRGESGAAKGWGFAVLSFFLGWWGFPMGLIWTPITIFQTLSGGKDVTQEMMAALVPPLLAAPVGGAGAPRNPWSSQ